MKEFLKAMNKMAQITLAGILSLPLAGFGQTATTQKLASGTYTVYAPSPQIWRVKIDPQRMANATISGHFAVTSGTPKTLDVLVFDEENYSKWKEDDADARKDAKPIASIMHSSEGDISAKLTEPGYHYLVISDRREYEGKKIVVADIKLQYDKH
jgi:hypothetical protein